jgi:hypothetical protein
MALKAVKIPEKTQPGEWWKHVYALDPASRGGYMFLGNFLSLGSTLSLPAGAVLIHYYEEDGDPHAELYVVNARGELALKADADGAGWAKELAPQVEKFLARNPMSALGFVPDDLLLAEAKRRKLI